MEKIEKQPKKAVIFDMDGVIFDSERLVYEGWMELADKYGFEDFEIPYRRCIGSNAIVSKQIFLDFYGKDFPYDIYKEEQSKKYHERYDHGRLPLKPGVRELLEYLQGQQYGSAIASSTRTSLVRQQIADAGLLTYFDRITGGDQVTKSKPEPDIFLAAAQEWELSKKDIYVIEDSYNGIRAAKAAGMKAIMVPDLLGANEEMHRLADDILPTLLAVKEQLCMEDSVG